MSDQLHPQDGHPGGMGITDVSKASEGKKEEHKEVEGQQASKEVAKKESSEVNADDQKSDGSTVALSFQVPKGLNDFALALANLVKAAESSLKDGFQPGSDIPALVTAAIADLGAITSNMGTVIPSIKAQPLESAIAIANAIQSVLK